MLIEVVMNSSKYGHSSLEIMKNNEEEKWEREREERGWVIIQCPRMTVELLADIAQIIKT